MATKTPLYERPLLDHLLVGAIVSAHAIAVARTSFPAFWEMHDATARAAIYGRAGVVASLLLTVSVAIIGLYSSGKGERTVEVRRRSGAAGLKMLYSPIPALLGVAVSSLLAMIVDGQQATAPEWGRHAVWLTEYLALLAGYRVGRALLLYEPLLSSEVDG